MSLALERPDLGLLLVVSGASGTGKSTLLSRLFSEVPGLEFSVSATTRAPREGEVDGREYHFVTRPDFLHLKETGKLLENAEVYNNFYGTPKEPVTRALSEGRSIVLDIDVQGAAQVRQNMPEAVSIFILPPSLESLRERLVARGTDSLDVIEKRMRQAYGQLGQASAYDFLVMNDDLEVASRCFNSIVISELSRKTRRNTWLNRVLG